MLEGAFIAPGWLGGLECVTRGVEAVVLTAGAAACLEAGRLAKLPLDLLTFLLLCVC